jgi:hypothetical protein
VSASNLSDESLLRYYDRANQHKFMTVNSIKDYARHNERGLQTRLWPILASRRLSL